MLYLRDAHFRRTIELTHRRDSADKKRKELSETKTQQIGDAPGCWVQLMVRLPKLCNSHLVLSKFKSVMIIGGELCSNPNSQSRPP